MGHSSWTMGRFRQGVTMVELMVVVVIIGVLSAMAVPRFIRITGENQLDGDFRTFYGDLMWARAHAMKTGELCRAVFSADASSGTSRLKLTIYKVNPSTKALTELRNSVSGPTIQLGLPSGVAAPAVGAIPAVGRMGSVSGGYQAVSGGETAPTCRNESGAIPQWSDGIQVCGSVLGDVESGAVYFRSTRSDARAYGLLFDRTKSLTFVQMRFMGGSWEKL